MNRWQTWAQRLRQRHVRIDAWRAQGAMVLLHAVGAPASTLGHSVRSIGRWHTRLSISPRFMLSLLPAARSPASLRMVGAGAPARAAEPAQPSTRTPSLSPMPRASLLSLRTGAVPAFVTRSASRAPATLMAPRGAAILLRSRRHEFASTVAARAGETAARLRRNVARQELPSASPAVVLAAPQRAAAFAAASAAQAVVQGGTARQHTEEPRFAPPAPTVNVEALTGMVIQQIDRRLVAYRERMGRV